MVKVLSSGFFSTIQDYGRIGAQDFGVPISGVMDRYSAKLANTLVGNDEAEAVLEITMTGPTLEFNCETIICLAGARMQPKINGKDVKYHSVLKVQEGDVLSFGKLMEGFRCYLAVSGGLKSDSFFGSRSMYKGITTESKLKKGDVLRIEKKHTSIKLRHARLKMPSDHFSAEDILVYKGPEYNLLSENQKKILEQSRFTIAKENNRMAYQLEEELLNNLKPIITSLVLPGTVQLTPSGKLIVLMRDAQVTGGYPRILHLSNVSINKLAQKFTGKRIVFKLIG